MPKVLVANRGEIAIRVFRSARELGWHTVAVYTKEDNAHASYADEAILLAGAEQYMDTTAMVDIAHSVQATHVHPGYGFLSESADFSRKLASAAPPINFIGPSVETLGIAGDKMKSRQISTSLNIPVSPGIGINSVVEVRRFCKQVGFPVMVKAVDGGGGRGIRLVSGEEQIEEAFVRSLGESPSKQIFVEKAMVGSGWRHIEVQIVGDGSGKVTHLWERDCSAQRRFQKVIEIAPSRLSSDLVQPLLKSSLRIARTLKYKGLGTFEYLVDADSGDWVFLEINPRIQVEHTITEEITGLDLVKIQLALFQGSTSLSSLGLSKPPEKRGHAIQMRLTAEDPATNFRLSVGRISGASFPSGRGVRIDTWLSNTGNHVVGPFYDSLLAKIIVSGPTFSDSSNTAKRAVAEIRLAGNVKTNIDVLSGLLASSDWESGRIDTLWLERNVDVVLTLGRAVQRNLMSVTLEAPLPTLSPDSAFSSSSVLLQPGSTFNLELSPPDSKSRTLLTKHTISISSISNNTFPSHLSGTMSTSLSPSPLRFSLKQSKSTPSTSADTELADSNNPRHVPMPLTGKIVELHSAFTDDSGGQVNKGEILLVVSAMKMENTVVMADSGCIKRIGRGINVGSVVSEGTLICEVETQPVMSKL